MFYNRLINICLIIFLFISCERDIEDIDNSSSNFYDNNVAAFYNHYDGITYNLYVYLEFLNYMDNIESVMGKIQSMDSLLFEFNLSELNINSKVFIYEGTLLDENSETILSDNIYLYDMTIDILFTDSTYYSFTSDLTTPIDPNIIDYSVPENFKLDSTNWTLLSIDLEIKDLNGHNNIESVGYEIKTILLNGCDGDCVIDDNCNEDFIGDEYISDDTWIFDYIESSSDSTYIYNETIFMRPLNGQGLAYDGICPDENNDQICDGFETTDCGKTGVVEFKFIVKDKDGLSNEVDGIMMEIID